jgi:putative flippase GtrA
MRSLEQIAKYYWCGLAALVIDLALFRLGLVAGLLPWLAAALSYATAASVHFLTNRSWTFQCSGNGVPAQAARYVLVVSAGCVMTVVIVALLTSSIGVPPFYAKLASAAALSPLAFFGHKFITFSEMARRADI